MIDLEKMRFLRKPNLDNELRVYRLENGDVRVDENIDGTWVLFATLSANLVRMAAHRGMTYMQLLKEVVTPGPMEM